MNKKAATKEQFKKAIVKVSGLIEQVKSLLSAHTGNKNNPHGVTAAQIGAAAASHTHTPASIGAAAASHGTHVSYSSTAPKMDGTASAGTASSVARSDHVHPTDTSRAAASHTHSGYAAASHTHTAADVGAAKKPLTGSVTIPTSGWGSDSTATYPKYYDIAVTGVTTSDRANVDIAPASLSTAATCGLCPTTETLAGKIRIRAASVPTAAMTANYWIEKGA